MAKRRNLRKEKAERNKIYARKFRKVSRKRFSGRGKGRPGMGQGSNSENSENSEQSGQSNQSSQSNKSTYDS